MNRHSEFKLYGILGYPLAHTLSPAMQEAAFAKSGLKAFYLALELSPRFFLKAVKALPSLVLDGFNVTVPYKEKILPYLDGLTPEAKAIGAVNTVFRKGRSWIGANTDVDGFLASLKGARFRLRGKRVLVLGAGGSARAVIYGLGAEGAKSVTIVNRHPERAKKIAAQFRKRFQRTSFKIFSLKKADFKTLLGGTDLAVNTTSVGLKRGEGSVLPAREIPRAGKNRKIFFYDLIYRPKHTPFLKAAKSRGHRGINGLEMLLLQGAASFRYWTGRTAPVREMRKALLGALEGSSG